MNPLCSTVFTQLRISELVQDLTGVVASRRDDFALLTIAGKDRVDFLHRMTSQNFKNLRPADLMPGAFLNGNGTVVALFYAFTRGDQIDLLISKRTLPRARAFLEKFHFGEDMTYTEATETQWIEVRGDGIQGASFGSVAEASFLAPRGLQPGLWLRIPKSVDVAGVLKVTRWVDTPQLLDTYEQIPTDGVDVSESNILLEMGRDEYVHRNKGCYPGQEVIERIFTYGNVAKKIVSVEVVGPLTDCALAGPRELPLLCDGKRVGHLTSVSVFSDGALGFATTLRLKAQGGTLYEVEGFPFQVRLRAP